MRHAASGLLLAYTLFVGCSRGSNATPVDSGVDAVPVDSGVDAVPVDSGVDAVPVDEATVVTEAALFGRAIGAMVGDIDIISNLPDNTILATAKTDARGRATIKVYPGGSVTAIYQHTVDTGADLITWVGVKPGDTLAFGSRDFSNINQPNNVLGLEHYTWPSLAGATNYEVSTGCTTVGITNATSNSAMESSLCHHEPMDVLFTARNSSGLIGFGFRSNVVFTNGGTIALSEWSPAQVGSVDITGLAPEISSVSGNILIILDGAPRAAVSSYRGTPTGGAFSTNFQLAPTGERLVGALTLDRPMFNSMQLLEPLSPSTSTHTVAAPALPPWVQGRAVLSSTVSSASWSLVSGPLSIYDGQLLHLSWRHMDPFTGPPHQWFFILPPGPTSITFPTLPSQFGDHIPSPGDDMAAPIRVFDISSITDYDMVRRMPSSNIMCLECAASAGDLQRVVFSN